MATFTIDSEYKITAHAGPPADADNSASFTNQKELAKLTAEWPISRLVDTWNKFVGVVPFEDLKAVKKFASRKAAIARIWKAIERLFPDVAQPGKAVVPAKGKAKQSPTKSKRRDTGRTGAKGAATVAREGTKKGEVFDLMRRKSGATLSEIMALTGWQSHTVRGFVSGTLVKKLGLKVESFRTKEKERTYRING
jgi:hypothetical protein